MAEDTIVIPPNLEIHPKFFSFSQSLKILSDDGQLLFDVKCPSFRMKKDTFIYTAGEEKKLFLWMSPVWGVNWNVMVSKPDDTILGVLQKNKDLKTGQRNWSLVDSSGNELLSLTSDGSFWDRARKKFSLFSTTSESIYLKGKKIGAIFRKSGYIQETLKVKLDKGGNQEVDNRLILALAVASTGIFQFIFSGR